MPVKEAMLGHVVLNVRNLRRSENFYRRVLGMAVSGRDRSTKMSFLSFGREHHDVALAQLPAGARPITGKRVPGLHHFCVYVQTPQEVDRLAPILRRKRIRIVSGPEILKVARNRSISFLDPDGNRVEVACNAHKFPKKRRRRRAQNQ